MNFTSKEEERKIVMIVDNDSFSLMIKICDYEHLQAQNGANDGQIYEKH